MRKIAIAMAALAIMAASGTERVDTVKVINNAKQVIITERGSDIRMKVNGLQDDDDYNYEYRVKQDSDGSITTTETENKNVELKIPFKRCGNEKDSHFEVFLSDVYMGWGRTDVEAGAQPYIRKKAYEAGVLNLVALGYKFNQNRSRLSLGVGFNWAFYGTKNPYLWATDDAGHVGVGQMEDYDLKHRHANLVVRSLQFPLMFNQRVGEKVYLAVAGVMNWNYYANLENRFKIDKNDFNVKTRGLHQRKVSFDVMAIASWRKLGVYFRYSPQSVFKGAWGPELKNRWSLGIMLHGF